MYWQSWFVCLEPTTLHVLWKLISCKHHMLYFFIEQDSGFFTLWLCICALIQLRQYYGILNSSQCDVKEYPSIKTLVFCILLYFILLDIYMRDIVNSFRDVILCFLNTIVWKWIWTHKKVILLKRKFTIIIRNNKSNNKYSLFWL